MSLNAFNQWTPDPFPPEQLPTFTAEQEIWTPAPLAPNTSVYENIWVTARNIELNFGTISDRRLAVPPIAILDTSFNGTQYELLFNGTLTTGRIIFAPPQ